MVPTDLGRFPAPRAVPRETRAVSEGAEAARQPLSQPILDSQGAAAAVAAEVEGPSSPDVILVGLTSKGNGDEVQERGERGAAEPTVVESQSQRPRTPLQSSSAPGRDDPELGRALAASQLVQSKDDVDLEAALERSKHDVGGRGK
ncbi:unnamed protein product, partial [Prorocentrum cordatum]